MTVHAALEAYEQTVVEAVRLDDAWALVEELSTLVRDAGSEQEREAVAHITKRLDAWGVEYTLHVPELLIGLPGRASLAVEGATMRAKAASMAAATPAGGLTAPLVHEPTARAASMGDLFAEASGEEDLTGGIVLVEGFPIAGRTTDLAARGAIGVVAVAPGERIHEMICTPIWGSPDLSSWPRQPTIPVASIARPDGERLIERLARGPADATLVAEQDIGWRGVPVLVAEIRGQIEPERFVLVHGHLDSWHVGVGDNATGDAALLELARVLAEHRDGLARSVRIAWWSGHSQGRYAGSTWYADAFALELECDCVCHVDCDSPGCRDADVYEDVFWMAEAEAFARQAIRDFAGQEATGGPPPRAGDVSFNNLGVSTFFMLSSTMSAELRERRGLYPVGGCGANVEWHTEADTLEIADRGNLLRDMRLYAGAVARVANAPLHPLDFRATVGQVEEVLDEHADALERFVDLCATRERLVRLRSVLGALHTRAQGLDVAAARPFNDALVAVGRELVPVLYAREAPHRQDPALHIPLLPDVAGAVAAMGSVPDGVVRIELTRARNRLDRALQRATAAVEEVLA
jgi:N-acetylated-alpha-linked acidic dipeptidase